MTRRSLRWSRPVMALFPFLCAIAAPLFAQAPQTQTFLAEKYEVTAYLDTYNQTINAIAKIEFRAQEASSVVRVELHQNLDVKEVKSAEGKPLVSQRDNENPLILNVTLNAPVAAGKTTTLTFSYNGLLGNEENSPIPGTRVAYISKDWAYLLQPSRWFPLTNYPSSRYTGTFRFNVPDTFVVAGTGKGDSPQTLPARAQAEGPRLMYTFHCDQSAPNGSYVAGPLQLSPKQAEGISVNVYAPPADSGKAQAFANVIAHQEIIFSDMFGPLPDPTMTLIQIPDGTLRDFAAPGVLMLSHRLWDPKWAERTLSRLVASQWWGNQVLPATTADMWIRDGLARYSEALYAEQNSGKEAGMKAIDEFAVGALMYEDAVPVAQSARLVPYSPEYRSVVMNKGAMLFHMLRAQMGDAAFKSLLHGFYAKFAGKSAHNEDFEQMAIAEAERTTKPGEEPPNLQGYFAQWMNSTGLPEFTIEYVTYRTPKGFRVIGKIKQPLDTFSMPVQLRVDTEGNPETKTIDVIGTESEFTVETFGRPKPGGIKVDPNNLILKGTPGLRARAAVARGEELAEVGRYNDAIGQYQKALSIQPNRALANFRMGEAFFYEKNYQAAANSFRDVIAIVPEPAEKWTEVWSHIYLGKILDLLGQRERALNEYNKARQTNDNTGSAQDTIEALIKKPYTEGGQPTPTNASATPPADSKKSDIPEPASGDRPTFKKKPNPSPQP